MGLTSTDRACGPPAFLLHLLPSRVLALSPAPLLPFHSSCPAPTWAASRVQGLSVRGGRALEQEALKALALGETRG